MQFIPLVMKWQCHTKCSFRECKKLSNHTNWNSFTVELIMLSIGKIQEKDKILHILEKIFYNDPYRQWTKLINKRISYKQEKKIIQWHGQRSNSIYFLFSALSSLPVCYYHDRDLQWSNREKITGRMMEIITTKHARRFQYYFCNISFNFARW